MMGPTYNGYYIYDDTGKLIASSPNQVPIGAPGYVENLRNYADELGHQSLMNRMDSMVVNGELTRPPRTPQEAAYAQMMLERYASQQSRNNYDEAMQLLGGGGGMNDPGFGGSGGGNSDRLAGMRGMFETSLQGVLNDPGLSDDAVERIISRGTDEIRASQRDAGLDMRDVAQAAGAGSLSDLAGGLSEMRDSYDRQSSALARDVRLAAEQDRSQQRLAGLGVAGNYLGRVEDAARQDRNKLMELLLSQKFQTPDMGGMIQNAGLNGGTGTSGLYGGGANSGQRYAGDARKRPDKFESAVAFQPISRQDNNERNQGPAGGGAPAQGGGKAPEKKPAERPGENPAERKGPKDDPLPLREGVKYRYDEATGRYVPVSWDKVGGGHLRADPNRQTRELWNKYGQGLRAVRGSLGPVRSTATNQGGGNGRYGGDKLLAFGGQRLGSGAYILPSFGSGRAGAGGGGGSKTPRPTFGAGTISI